MAGAPFGNQNAAKAKQWTAAIERAIERLGTGQELDDNDDRSPRAKGLDRLADEFVKSVRAGANYKAFAELGDRIEGKVAQAHELSGPDGGPIETKNRLDVGFVAAEKQGG